MRNKIFATLVVLGLSAPGFIACDDSSSPPGGGTGGAGNIFGGDGGPDVSVATGGTGGGGTGGSTVEAGGGDVKDAGGETAAASRWCVIPAGATHVEIINATCENGTGTTQGPYSNVVKAATRPDNKPIGDPLPALQ